MSAKRLGGLPAQVAERSLSRLLQLDNAVMELAESSGTGPIDPGGHQWSRLLEAGWDEIRAELDDALGHGMQMPGTDEVVGQPQGAGSRWQTYILHWWGHWPETCGRFPATVSLLRPIPGLQIAGFTALRPGAHIPLHQGPSRSFRYHLGIRIPAPVGSCRLRVGDQVIAWADGEGLAFDDRTPHEAWNDSGDTRYVLFVQTAWPAAGLPGLLHRTTDAVLASATRGIERRAVSLDRGLNGR